MAGRILLIGLTVWALLMIAPDLYRVVDPLGSAGFAADNDGREIEDRKRNHRSIMARRTPAPGTAGSSGRASRKRACVV